MIYRPEIDGLRALAVLPVVLFHAGFVTLSGGFIGVDIFFVISGYLISSIIVEDLVNDRFDIFVFYERRIRRIFPALFFIIFCCIPVAWMYMMPSQMKEFAGSAAAAAIFISNIFFWRERGDYFDSVADEKPLLHTWSLGVEEQYYLLFPIFMLFMWKSRKSVLPFLCVVAVASFALAEGGWRNNPLPNFYLAPTRAWELLAGALAGLTCYGVEPKSRAVCQILSGIGFIAVLCSIVFFDEAMPFPSAYTLIPVFGTCLLLVFGRAGTVAGRILSLKILVGLGLISYSTYLWHQPVFAFARIIVIGQPSSYLMAGLTFSSFILAFFTWKFVERPFRRTGEMKKAQPYVFGTAFFFIVCLLFFGVIGHTTNGFAKQRPGFSFVERELEFVQIGEERQGLIRAGLCHFNYGGINNRLDAFLQHWDCKSNDEDLRDGRVVITGDSHSADKVVALRLNGVDSAQLGGAGCQLSLSFIPSHRKDCAEIISRAWELAQGSGVEAVFLSNRFPLKELSPEYLQSIFEFWKSLNKPIYLWSPMPDFSDDLKRYLRGYPPNGIPSFERERKFFEIINELVVPENFKIVKTSDFWCGEALKEIECLSFVDSKFLMADEDHLGMQGAKIFGENMLEHSDFFFLVKGAAE
ncbi:acyltransferase [Litorivicinus sp.]|nr:acyltransferase [Litorivicinus sp.]